MTYDTSSKEGHFIGGPISGAGAGTEILGVMGTDIGDHVKLIPVPVNEAGREAFIRGQAIGQVSLDIAGNVANAAVKDAVANNTSDSYYYYEDKTVVDPTPTIVFENAIFVQARSGKGPAALRTNKLTIANDANAA